MNSKIQTGRDPFARQTIRKHQHEYKRSCDWCGFVPARGWVWQYTVDSDSPRGSGDIEGGFCNVECLNAYHGY